MKLSASKWVSLACMLAILIPAFAYMAVFVAVAIFGVRGEFFMQAGRILIWPVLIVTAVVIVAATVWAFAEWSEMK